MRDAIGLSAMCHAQPDGLLSVKAERGAIGCKAAAGGGTYKGRTFGIEQVDTLGR